MSIGFFDSDDLIASIKRRAQIPTSQRTFQDADFLAMANEEIDMGLVPHIMSYHEDYFLTSIEIPLEANVSSYDIPYRAIGNKIRDVSYKDSNGNLFPLHRIPVEDRVFYDTGNQSGGVSKYYLQSSQLVMVPAIGSSITGSLVVFYYLRPNDLVATSRAAVISAIDTNTGVITVDSVPSNITDGSVIDFIQAKYGNRTLGFDITVTSTTSTTITFDASDLPSDIIVGDHVCSAGETIIPQVPSDLHVMLAQRVAARCLEAIGDTQGLQNANTKLAEMEQKTNNIIENRAENSPLKVVNRSGLIRTIKSRNKVFF